MSVPSSAVPDQTYVDGVAPAINGLLDGKISRPAQTTRETGGNDQRIERRRKGYEDRFMMCHDEREPLHDFWLQSVVA